MPAQYVETVVAWKATVGMFFCWVIGIVIGFIVGRMVGKREGAIEHEQRLIDENKLRPQDGDFKHFYIDEEA